ncbi:putative SM-like small nuclear ribonucleoprotein [Vairimorpha necatrix]|uniref:SM-like small nuclear ribonucleoprotein n=1 Tax=Vairimorpha necatrix TaxID=6039 RepID=A0AAX4J963_9MICR
MIKSPLLHLKDQIGRNVIIYTFNNKKISGILSGVDVYVNVHLREAREEQYLGDVIINGSNVLFFDLH